MLCVDQSVNIVVIHCMLKNFYSRMSAVHMKCFVAYRAEIYGETCAICSKPLWEENKEQSGSRGFRRRSSFSKKWNGDVHVHCLESSQKANLSDQDWPR